MPDRRKIAKDVLDRLKKLPPVSPTFQRETRELIAYEIIDSMGDIGEEERASIWTLLVEEDWGNLDDLVKEASL